MLAPQNSSLGDFRAKRERARELKRINYQFASSLIKILDRVFL
jgi:hypothetical protein